MSNSVKFLMDEKAISKKLGINIKAPIRMFNLEGLGIDQKEFIETFSFYSSNLDWDLYDVKIRQFNYLLKLYPEQSERLNDFIDRYFDNKTDLNEINNLLAGLPAERMKEFKEISPYRRRSIAKFTVERLSDDSFNVTREKVKSFSQNTGKNDYRSKERIFTETSIELTSHPLFRKLFDSIMIIIAEVEPSFQIANVNFHQMNTITRANNIGEGAPEGIHKDGCDYIVSALIIERGGIVGGESIIYGPDKKTEYLKVTLEPGEGILQADQKSDLWHYVTPILLDHNSNLKEGKRNRLGFDINIVK